MNKIAGMNGIIISQALTDVLTAILAVSMFVHLKGKENISIKKQIELDVQ